MNASLPPILLRLGEADIVRLCGFEAATRGLELAGRQAVSQTRRDGARLAASVADETPLAVLAEIADDASHPALRWRCSGHGEAGAENLALAQGPGCQHVAALLTVWIRAPGDFLVPVHDSPPQRTRAPVQSDHPPSQSITTRRRGARPRLQPPMMTPRAGLDEELMRLPARDLLAMTRRILNVDLSEASESEASESEARDQLARALADPRQVESLLARLSSNPRWLFGALQALGGAITAADLETLAGRLGRAPSALQADVESLARYGLLFTVLSPRVGSAAGEHSWRSLAGWHIAPETRAAAHGLYPLEALLYADANERAIATAGWRVERSSPREIILALALLARAPAPFGPLAREGRVGVTPANPRDGLLRVVGDLPAARLAELARAAGLEPGLARMTRRVLLWAREQSPGQPLLDLARLAAAERVRALLQAFALWRETDSVAELADLDLAGAPIRARVDTWHAAYSSAAVAAEVGAARRFMLSLLTRARPGVWYAFDDLLTFIWRAHPGFLRGRQHAFARPTWLIERADGDRRTLRATVEGDWRAAEGVWIRALFLGPLRWWGAVDLAHDVSTRTPVAFRLTPLGARLLDVRDAPSDVTLPDDWGPAILLTRDHALVANPLSAGVDLLDTLAQWARPASVVGRRLLYTLAPDLACAAFDHGLEPIALGARLRAADPHAGARVAEQVTARLSAWRMSYGRTRLFERVTLLEARDEPALVEALAYAPAVAARARRIGPALALLTLGDLAELRTQLARKGYDL